MLVVPAMAAGQAGAQSAPARESRTTTIEAVIDPSLRSTLATPTVQLAVEFKDDTKFATSKLGFSFLPGWTGEFGFSGAFDHRGAASRPSSLRRLTDGSSVWAATTWTRASAANRHLRPLVAARGETGRDAFDYYDLALGRHTDTHRRYAVTATAGLILPHSFMAAASYRWSEAWQVDDRVEPCYAAADTGATYCAADRLFRRAVPQRWQQLEAQVRAPLGGRVGVELFVTRDFRDDAWGVEVPVYFMARRDGGLAGGLVMTYNGAVDRMDVSLFVGQVFRPFK